MTLALLQEAVGTGVRLRLMGRVSRYFFFHFLGFTPGLSPLNDGVQNSFGGMPCHTPFAGKATVPQMCTSRHELVPDVDNSGTSWFSQQLCLSPLPPGSPAGLESATLP